MKDEHELIPLTKDAFEDLRELVISRMATHEYWIIVPGLEALQAVGELGGKFFAGGEVSDFEVHNTMNVFRKIGLYGFAFALKSRLSAYDLMAFIRTRSLAPQVDDRPFTSLDLMKGDVITWATPDEADFLHKNFYAWINPAGYLDLKGFTC